MRTNPVLRKSPSSPTVSRQCSKICRAHQRELHFGRIAVVHADQRRGASAAALADVAFVDDHDFSCAPLGEVERDGRAHHTSAENHDVSRGCPGVPLRTGFGIGSHVDEVFDPGIGIDGPTLKISCQFSVASSRISVLLVMRRPLSAGLFSSPATPGGPRCGRELR